MFKQIRYSLKPTARQSVLLNELLSDQCDLYNAALQERREAWIRTSTNLTWFKQATQVKEVRKLVPSYKRWPANVSIETVRKLDKAYQAFFRRVKNGQVPGFPRFKSKARYNSVTLPKHGDGYKYIYDSGRYGKLYIKGIGHIKLRVHQSIAKEAIKTATIVRSGKRWFATICYNAEATPKQLTGAMVGLDMATGGNGLAYSSDGLRIANPQYYKNAANKLYTAQHELSRKKKGSNRRKKAVLKIANLHRKTANSRQFYLHKITTELVRDYDYIAIENLKIANMTHRPKPKQDEIGTYLPNGTSAKAGLNKSIFDSGWGYFKQMLTYKAEEAGKQLVLVDPKHTSQTCSNCEFVDKKSRNSKQFKCTKCNFEIDADINAAKNILRAGLALQPML